MKKKLWTVPQTGMGHSLTPLKNLNKKNPKTKETKKKIKQSYCKIK
jgi:hypothetical protein